MEWTKEDLKDCDCGECLLRRDIEADDREAEIIIGLECLGHPAGLYDPMGKTIYCDGTCRF